MSRSWLVLERYALGECDPTETRVVEETLAADPQARAILAAIRSDARPLPPLTAPTDRPPRRPRWVWGLAPLALAAAALVAVVVNPWEDRPDHPPDRVKGGDLALTLVRLRDGVQTAAPAEVAAGDRLALRLTCPPGPTAVDVVVVHGGEVGFPIPAAVVECGNQVPVPGAFSVDGAGRLVVCVAVGDLPGRELLAEDPWAADRCVETVVR
jgi:hypothetical protein